MSNKAGGSLGILMGIALFAIAWPYGIWHAFSEHGAGHGVAGVLLPPYAWYLTTESFWHNENTVTKVDGEEEAVKQLVDKCQKDEDQFKKSGLGRNEYNLFCSCYSTKMISTYPKGESNYFDKHGRNSPELYEIAKTNAVECFEVAKH